MLYNEESEIERKEKRLPVLTDNQEWRIESEFFNAAMFEARKLVLDVQKVCIAEYMHHQKKNDYRPLVKERWAIIVTPGRRSSIRLGWPFQKTYFTKIVSPEYSCLEFVDDVVEAMRAWVGAEEGWLGSSYMSLLSFGCVSAKNTIRLLTP